MTIAEHVGNEARAKVSSKIDSIACLPAKARTDAKDDEEESKWCEWASAQVPIILEDVDEEHEESGSNELGEELSSLGHELCWVGAKDTSGSSRSSDGTHAAALELVDGTLVVSVDDCSSTHGTEDLCQHVAREFPPGKLSEHTVGESDGGIQVSTRNTRSVDT